MKAGGFCSLEIPFELQFLTRGHLIIQEAAVFTVVVNMKVAGFH